MYQGVPYLWAFYSYQWCSYKLPCSFCICINIFLGKICRSGISNWMTFAFKIDGQSWIASIKGWPINTSIDILICHNSFKPFSVIAGSLGQGRSSGGGSGNLLQYSFLGNPMDRRDWQTTVQGVPKSWTWLRYCTCMHTHTHFFVIIWYYLQSFSEYLRLLIIFVPSWIISWGIIIEIIMTGSFKTV